MIGLSSGYNTIFFSCPTLMHKNHFSTARHLHAKEEEIKDEESEERNDEVRLPDGHNLEASDEDTNGIIIDNPNTWPINSEKARQLRRGFVQEGYRRLYFMASGQMPLMGSDDVVGNNENNTVSGQLPQFRLGTEGGGTVDTEPEPNNVTNGDERPPPSSINGDEDWLYFAQ